MKTFLFIPSFFIILITGLPALSQVYIKPAVSARFQFGASPVRFANFGLGGDIRKVKHLLGNYTEMISDEKNPYHLDTTAVNVAGNFSALKGRMFTYNDTIRSVTLTFDKYNGMKFRTAALTAYGMPDTDADDVADYYEWNRGIRLVL